MTSTEAGGPIRSARGQPSEAEAPDPDAPDAATREGAGANAGGQEPPDSVADAPKAVAAPAAPVGAGTAAERPSPAASASGGAAPTARVAQLDGGRRSGSSDPFAHATTCGSAVASWRSGFPCTMRRARRLTVGNRPACAGSLGQRVRAAGWGLLRRRPGAHGEGGRAVLVRPRRGIVHGLRGRRPQVPECTSSAMVTVPGGSRRLSCAAIGRRRGRPSSRIAITTGPSVRLRDTARAPSEPTAASSPGRADGSGEPSQVSRVLHHRFGTFSLAAPVPACPVRRGTSRPGRRRPAPRTGGRTRARRRRRRASPARSPATRPGRRGAGRATTPAAGRPTDAAPAQRDPASSENSAEGGAEAGMLSPLLGRPQNMKLLQILLTVLRCQKSVI